jgi:hypothetical protein
VLTEPDARLAMQEGVIERVHDPNGGRAGEDEPLPCDRPREPFPGQPARDERPRPAASGPLGFGCSLAVDGRRHLVSLLGDGFRTTVPAAGDGRQEGLPACAVREQVRARYG